MNNRRILLGLAMALALVVSQVSVAAAAPLNGGGGTSTCSISSPSQVTYDSTTNTYSVTCDNGSTATLTQDEASLAGLITVVTTIDPITGLPTTTVTDNWLTASSTTPLIINVGAGLLVADPCFVSSSSTGGTGGSTGGDNNPVPAALAAFFCGSSTDAASMLEQLHMEGFGFGEIAQALFMSQFLGTGLTAEQILMDKQNHDFSGIVLPDGSTPKNWGMLIKWMLGQGVKNMTNLGAIMSGRATPTATGTEATAAPLTNGHGNSGNHGRSGDHGNNGNHGKP